MWDITLIHSATLGFLHSRMWADPSLVLTQKDWREEQQPPIVRRAPHYLSLALRLRQGLASCLPSRWSSLNTSCVLDSFQLVGKSRRDLPCSGRGRSPSLYSATDGKKTIDECNSNVTPVPPGNEETSGVGRAHPLGLKCIGVLFLGLIIIHPEAPDRHKELTVSVSVGHIYASSRVLLHIFTLN